MLWCWCPAEGLCLPILSVFLPWGEWVCGIEKVCVCVWRHTDRKSLFCLQENSVSQIMWWSEFSYSSHTKFWLIVPGNWLIFFVLTCFYWFFIFYSTQSRQGRVHSRCFCLSFCWLIIKWKPKNITHLLFPPKRLQSYIKEGTVHVIFNVLKSL